jgi:hypothetical protein
MRFLHKSRSRDVLIIVALMASAAPTFAQGQAGTPAIGTRVVIPLTAVLKVSDRTVETGPEPRIYEVERVHGAWLWLRSDSVCGWARTSDAVRLDTAISRTVAALIDRGDVFQAKHEFSKAIADYGKAIRLDPKHLPGWLHRGMAWKSMGEDQKAVADYESAIRVGPSSPWGYACLASILSSSRVPSVRNGSEALTLAQKACDLGGIADAYLCDVRADAYEAAGEPETARVWRAVAAKHERHPSLVGLHERESLAPDRGSRFDSSLGLPAEASASDDNSIGYLSFIPPDYRGSESAPLVLLHSSGAPLPQRKAQRGDSLSSSYLPGYEARKEEIRARKQREEQSQQSVNRRIANESSRRIANEAEIRKLARWMVESDRLSKLETGQSTAIIAGTQQTGVGMKALARAAHGTLGLFHLKFREIDGPVLPPPLPPRAPQAASVQPQTDPSDAMRIQIERQSREVDKALERLRTGEAPPLP